YATPPDLAEWVNHLWWAKDINHPYLHTIYPPLAEALFFFGSLVNPFFLADFAPSFAWQVTFGWKIIVAIGVALTIHLLRHRRWDLVAAHPLYLATFVGNGHIDGFLVLAFAALVIIQGQRIELKQA